MLVLKHASKCVSRRSCAGLRRLRWRPAAVAVPGHVAAQHPSQQQRSLDVVGLQPGLGGGALGSARLPPQITAVALASSVAGRTCP